MKAIILTLLAFGALLAADKPAHKIDELDALKIEKIDLAQQNRQFKFQQLQAEVQKLQTEFGQDSAERARIVAEVFKKAGVAEKDHELDLAARTLKPKPVPPPATTGK